MEKAIRRAEDQEKGVIRWIAAGTGYTPSSASAIGSEPSISVRVMLVAETRMAVAGA
jgi:hypothetical protein